MTLLENLRAWGYFNPFTKGSPTYLTTKCSRVPIFVFVYSISFALDLIG